jgi:branched-chain amino acid transport system substrate-binding protein
MSASRLISRPVALLIAIAALAVAIPTASAAPVTVNVGAALSLTGEAAVYGISSRKGIDMAAKEINAGAITGVKVKVKTIDDFSTTAGAAAAYGVFFRDGVSTIVGPTLSSVALDVDPFAQAARIPVLGISNTQPGITEIGTFIFRPALTEDYVLPQVVKAVATSTLMPKTAVVIQGSDAFAASSGPQLATALTANGVTVKKTVIVPAGTTDYAAIAADVKANDPDLVALSALAPEGVPLLQALRNAGYKKAIIGSNGLNSNAIVKSAGAAANGLIVGTSWAAWNQTPANKTFIKAFKKAYKSTPDAFAAAAYAYTYVLATAAKNGKSATQDSMATQLAAITGTKNVKTLLGNFAFDVNRNGISPVLVQQVKGGKFGAFKTS